MNQISCFVHLHAWNEEKNNNPEDSSSKIKDNLNFILEAPSKSQNQDQNDNSCSNCMNWVKKHIPEIFLAFTLGNKRDSIFALITMMYTEKAATFRKT